MKCPVHNIDGKETGSIDLPDEIFNKPVNTDVIHQAIVMYQASLRQGNASTKERGDKRGGGRKPYRQKGTGRARVGSNRSPLFSGGGITFGPHPRDFGYSIPKKIKMAALKESLNVKFKDQNLLCLDDVSKSFEKTKEFAKALENLKIKGKTLAMLDGSDPSLNRVTRNIRSFNQVRSQDVNAYDIMRNKKILITKTALENILKRIS